MEKIAFIGSFDKADLMLYIAKTLDFMDKKVLVIDATLLQKTRYIVPKMVAAKRYITTFENVDVAVGFENYEQITEYQKQKEEHETKYDYVLVNVDSFKGYSNFKIHTEDKKFFVTSLDIYSLRRGLQVFKNVDTTMQVQKVVFSKEMTMEEDEYINYLSKELNIKWNEDTLFLPYELGDQSAIYINQRSERIQVKGLSLQYIDGIAYITQIITGSKLGEIKKAIKKLERN